MSDPIDIKQGATFKGASAYLGVPFMAVGFIAGIYAALNNWIALVLAVPLIAIGLVIFQVRLGTLIDPAAMRFKPYRDLVLFRIGPWIPLRGITSVRVKRQRETYSHDPGGAGIMRNSTRFWCFEVSLMCAAPINRVFVKELYDRDAALELARGIAERIGAQVEDDTQLPPVRTRIRR